MRLVYSTVEYTPQAYLQSDLQVFAKNYSTDLIGKAPNLVSIDGGKYLSPNEAYVDTEYQPSVRRLCADYIREL